MKKCSKCKEEKETTSFSKKETTKDKLDYWCKSCYKVYRMENKEDIAFTQKYWYINNRKK